MGAAFPAMSAFKRLSFLFRWVPFARGPADLAGKQSSLCTGDGVGNPSHRSPFTVMTDYREFSGPEAYVDWFFHGKVEAQLPSQHAACSMSGAIGCSWHVRGRGRGPRTAASLLIVAIFGGWVQLQSTEAVLAKHSWADRQSRFLGGALVLLSPAFLLRGRETRGPATPTLQFANRN